MLFRSFNFFFSFKEKNISSNLTFILNSFLKEFSSWVKKITKSRESNLLFFPIIS